MLLTTWQHRGSFFEPSRHNTPHFLDLAKIFIPNASENAYRSSEVGLGRKSFIRRSL